MNPYVYFRTDGNENTGLGHLFRCLSLAEIISPFFQSSFVLSGQTPSGLFEKINFTQSQAVFIDSLKEKEETESIISVVPKGSLLVIDSYRFSNSYYEGLLRAGYKTIVIDDQNNVAISACAVINHLIGSEMLLYRNDISFKLLGTQYAILRKQFLTTSEQVETQGSFLFNKIFICLGGSDQNNVTNRILQSMVSEFPAAEFKILVGESFTGEDDLRRTKQESKGNISIKKGLDALEMVRIMRDSQLAIITPGMISYELFSLGVPAFCGYISEYQKDVVKQFASFGLVTDVDDFSNSALLAKIHSLTQVEAKQQVIQQRRMFDGKSGERLLLAFKEIYGAD